MPLPDVPWALDQLRRFVSGSTRARQTSSGGSVDLRTVSSDDSLTAQAPIVEAILDRVEPEWRLGPTGMTQWRKHRTAAQRAITLLERDAELRVKLGDSAPTLDASQLHPWVWDGARSMWGSLQYAQAVVDALKKVNAEAQLKVGRRDVSETDLFNQLFSLDAPKADRPRLRLMRDDGSDTYSSVHRGARALAEGLFAGVRNRHSHEVPDTPAEEQHALEQLAAVSVLARWVDDAEVVTAQ